MTICLFFLVQSFITNAQCPPNIDFEFGDFTGWQCWVGNVSRPANINTITWNPNAPVVPNPQRHLMLSLNPGDGLDEYGFFPKKLP